MPQELSLGDDRTSKLAELDDYQSIDLSSDRGTKKDGLNELVRAIKRDVEHQAREL